MNVMMLTAGLGTRLRPLTLVRPKVLTPVMGVTVLDFWLDRLTRHGCKGLVLNAYHRADDLVSVVERRNPPFPARVRVEKDLLGTAGGVRNALDLLGNDPFAVVNGDVLCTAPLERLFEVHSRSGASVSMLLHDAPAFNNVAVDAEGQILGFGRTAKELARRRDDVRLMAYTGIQFLSASVVEHLEPGCAAEIVPLYVDRIASGDPPRAVFSDGFYWSEMGSVDSYRALHAEAARLPAGFLDPIPSSRNIVIHPEAEVAPDAELSGYVAIGRGSRVGAAAKLENTILWDDVVVAPESSLSDCVAADGFHASGRYRDRVLCPGVQA